MDSNMDQEYMILKDKANKFKQVLYQCKFTMAKFWKQYINNVIYQP